MIRVVTLDPFEQETLQQLTRILYQAFGLGCEYAGEVKFPEVSKKGEAIDPVELLTKAEAVRGFADDKVLYLTTRPLAQRELPSGKAPTAGFSQYDGERALVSSHGMPSGEALVKRLAKQCIHELGHVWELHHCLDPRCAMYAPWSPAFLTGEPSLCTFCREQSEQKIRMAKT